MFVVTIIVYRLHPIQNTLWFTIVCVGLIDHMTFMLHNQKYILFCLSILMFLRCNKYVGQTHTLNPTPLPPPQEKE